MFTVKKDEYSDNFLSEIWFILTVSTERIETMKKNYSSILTSTNVVTSAVNKAISKAQTGITTAASPLKTSNTAVKQSASIRPTTAPATYSTGRSVVDAQSIRKTLSDTRLLNEQKQREAQAVQQLPNDFPIENWEKMPVKAQLFAVQHSGLSKEDQWTVLNLMNPIKDLVNVAPPKPATVAQNRIAPINMATKTIPAKTTVTTSSASSGKEPVPFSGQDADTQRAEQRASRQATDAYNQLNETLGSKNVDTSNLSATGKDIYKNTRIAMANEVVKGTFDLSKQNKMIGDAAAAIAASKTAPTSVQDWKERVSQADTASKQLMDTLESVHVDTDHLTTQQSYIIEKAERMLRDGIISGALTIGGADEMVRRICNQVTSETTPPKGGAYVTLVDPKLDLRSAETKRNQIMINRGSAITQANQLLGDALESIHVDTSDLSEKQREIILEEQPKLVEGILNGSIKGDAISAFVDNVCYRMATETTPPPGVTYVRILDPSYQPKVQSTERIGEINSLLVDNGIDVSKFNNEQKVSYANAQQKIRNGATKGLLTDEYVDHIYSTLINELSSKKLEYEYTDARGRKAKGTTTTKDLIDPEDNSTGAKIARAAIELYEIERYSDVFMTDKDGKLFSKELDCSKLVYYAIHKANPTFANSTILGEAARHQIDNLGKRFNPDNVIWRDDGSQGDLDINQLKPGDLLYWANSKGKVVHTAIYLNNGLMIEANDFVEIGEVREFTDYGDGSGSTLVQVNRLPEME